VRSIKPILMTLAVLCLAGLVQADSHPMPLFGPQTFERLDGAPDIYVEPFEAPGSGPFVLFLRNGDGENSRVSNAAVELNGVPVIRPSDLSEESPGLARAIDVVAGSNQLRIELGGEPGTFVTIAIVRRGEAPVFVHGRLLLPWGSNDQERSLSLALKNGSLHFPRSFRVIFFRPNGQIAAATDRFVLPPRGSVSLSATELLGEQSWDVGSVEVYFAGPGVARLFGSARQAAPALGQAELLPLSQAGHRIFRGRPEPDQGGRGQRLP